MEIEIKKMGKDQMVYSPNRTGFADAKTIEELYEKKIDWILKLNHSTVTEEIKDKLVKRLQRCQFYDPRLPDIYYGTEESARKAIEIAAKLHTMTEKEFLVSEYPYQWLSELPNVSLFKVVDPSVLTPVE